MVTGSSDSVGILGVRNGVVINSIPSVISGLTQLCPL